MEINPSFLETPYQKHVKANQPYSGLCSNKNYHNE
jgi:hypothetical protein